MANRTYQTTDHSLYKAALIAPLVAPIAVLLFGPLLDRSISFLAAPVIMIVAVPAAYFAVLVVGLPCAFLLRRLRRLTVLHCVACATAVALIGGAIVGRNISPGAAGHEVWKMAVLSAIAAAAVATAGCLIAGVPWRLYGSKA